MKKRMGIILICVGAVAIIVGIIFIVNKGDSKNTVTASKIKNIDDVEAVEDTQCASNNDISVNKQKGNDFEDFVVNLLADNRFKLLDRTQDAVSSAGVYAESCKNPDLHIEQKYNDSDVDYYIECKYFSKWNGDVVKFNPEQIARYRDFKYKSRRKVLIAIGVGGTAKMPDTLRIVPLDSIKYDRVRRVDTQYAVAPNSSALYDYIDEYFTKVFENARNKNKN